uniref:Lipocalin/cytosolic fatty-acid binding domain-containing protein n=1 Tax=Zooxanthella nutricula TaxID=1333877 RepID=A0A7S2NIK0_9DINO
MMQGLWYEHRYMDLAQVFASCQTLNATVLGTGLQAGTMLVEFSVRYGPVPFSLRERYAPGDPPERGVFTKTVDLPGGAWIPLRTAVVDVGPAGPGGRYGSAAVYSCWASPVGPVAELLFVTRDPVPDEPELARLESVARLQGVPFGRADLRDVDHSRCAALEA